MSYNLPVMPKEKPEERLSQNEFKDSYEDIDIGNGRTSMKERNILNDMIFVDSQIKPQIGDTSAGSVFDLSNEDIEKYVGGLDYNDQEKNDIIGDLKKLVEENKKEQQEKVLNVLSFDSYRPKDHLLDIINTHQKLTGESSGDIRADVKIFVEDVFADFSDDKKATIKDQIFDKIGLSS